MKDVARGGHVNASAVRFGGGHGIFAGLCGPGQARSGQAACGPAAAAANGK